MIIRIGPESFGWLFAPLFAAYTILMIIAARPAQTHFRLDGKPRVGQRATLFQHAGIDNTWVVASGIKATRTVTIKEDTFHRPPSSNGFLWFPTYDWLVASPTTRSPLCGIQVGTNGSMKILQSEVCG